MEGKTNCSRARILVVNDFAQAHFRSGPEHLSHWPAIDGLEAVQKTEELRRDLILLDIGLPKLNGIEAALQIQQRAYDSAILILERNFGP
jgi:CheY-like chemotaxis protein